MSVQRDLFDLDPGDQRQVVAMGEREILRAAKEIRARQSKSRLAARMERHATLAMSVPMPQRRYPVLLADPPWGFKTFGEAGSLRSPNEHYPTLTIEQIAALDLPAAELAVLFLWTPVPQLPRALEVMTVRWGFPYRSNIVWVKDKAGLGYWARNQHEILLIGARGDIPAPEPSTRPNSVITAAVGRHSEKPVEAYALIERMYPLLPRIELFARARREGWECWGNEAPAAEQDDGFGIPPLLRRVAP